MTAKVIFQNPREEKQDKITKQQIELNDKLSQWR